MGIYIMSLDILSEKFGHEMDYLFQKKEVFRGGGRETVLASEEAGLECGPEFIISSSIASFLVRYRDCRQSTPIKRRYRVRGAGFSAQSFTEIEDDISEKYSEKGHASKHSGVVWVKK